MNLLPMTASDPVFWLGCSLFLVAVSLAVVGIAAMPVIQEMARVARSAERLLNTLDRELPRTLESLRATGSDLGNLQKEVNRGVKSAASVVEQVDRSLVVTKQQVGQAQTLVKRVSVGVKVAWRTFKNYPPVPTSTPQSIPPAVNPEVKPD
jgi:hypothetical protein